MTSISSVPVPAEDDHETVASDIERYVRGVGLVGEDDPQFSRSVHLFEEGYLDSLGTLGLIDHLERTYVVTLSSDTLADVSFTSIDGIAALVAAAVRRRVG